MSKWDYDGPILEIENLSIQNARHRLSSYIMDHIVDAPGGDQATARLELPRQRLARDTKR